MTRQARNRSTMTSDAQRPARTQAPEATAEHHRLQEAREQQAPWKKWGPYLSERQWGTVREDYSPSGDAWNYFSHDQARSRAYRWGEDGLAGISDDKQLLCFALALWNGCDPILKERLFGLTNSEGNHGEDVKEYYHYLDSTPTHSYMKYLYKYPQRAYPYADLAATNRGRSRRELEYELIDTGVFDENRYFDVFVEYGKASTEDLVIRITVWNRGPDAAKLHVLPTIWFRNTWSWGGNGPRPMLRQLADGVIALSHPELGERRMICEDGATLLFTENETNIARLFGAANRCRQSYPLCEGWNRQLFGAGWSGCGQSREDRHKGLRSVFRRDRSREVSRLSSASDRRDGTWRLPRQSKPVRRDRHHPRGAMPGS